jgi:ENT domain.
MPDLDEQRRKVEELKRKILEQKKKDVADASSSPVIDEFVEEEKKRAGMAERQALEDQRQTELASKRLVEETRHQVEEKSRRQQEEEKSRRQQEEEKSRRRQEEEKSHRQQKEEKRRTEIPKPTQAPSTVPVVSIQAYAQALKHAWSDGALSKDENAILVTLRKAMGISDQENVELEQEVQLDIYLQAIVDSWRSGTITPQDLDRLDILRDRFKISAEEHLRLEKQVRQEILRQR